MSKWSGLPAGALAFPALPDTRNDNEGASKPLHVLSRSLRLSLSDFSFSLGPVSAVMDGVTKNNGRTTLVTATCRCRGSVERNWWS